MRSTEICLPSAHGAREHDADKKISTHRFSILATLLIASLFAIINVRIGYRNLNTFRDHQRRIYQHNHDAPHIQSRQKRKHHGLSKSKPKHPRRTTSINIEPSAVHDGNYITQLLRGEIEPKSKADKHQRYKFQPGTLDMSSTESLQYCRVNTTLYNQHFPSGQTNGRVLVSFSESHKLIYRNIPKSASSSSRHAMENLFDGQDMRMKVQDLKSRVENDGYQVISFIREPLDRFYSSYDEAYFRKGPWFGEGRLVKNRPGEKKGYHKNKHKLDPYPYLYEGMKTYDEYRDKFCDKGSDKECKTVDTIDDGDLTRRFEQFVHDYSGLDPFDVHLSLQVPFLTDSDTGNSLPISMLYNATNADADWSRIASVNDIQVPDDGLIHGRKSPRRFNVSLVTDETKRKICKILMLDYCCLNLELPEVCNYELSQEEANGAFSCAIESRSNSFYISPWNNL